jgi:hypothetical protein
MKRYVNVNMIYALIVAIFLFGSCSVEYRTRHNHPAEEHHQDMNHDDHNNDHH